MTLSRVSAITLALFVQASELSATTIYSFRGPPNDGFQPIGGIAVDAQGVLYGVTVQGGSSGYGVVFELIPPAAKGDAWTEKIIHNFSAGASAYPDAGPVLGADGSLYGTTVGSANVGAIYQLSPPSGGNGPWTYSVIYNFTGAGDGGHPYGKVFLDRSGSVYATAVDGGYTGQNCGADGCGTVVRLDPSSQGSNTWTETTVWQFRGGKGDGRYPYGGLVADKSGRLFGTTNVGGRTNFGTVFQLTPPTQGNSKWSEKIIRDFSDKTSGDSPYGGLILDPAGNLFGTTFQCCVADWGPVFELSPTTKTKIGWAYKALFNFPASGSDGEYLEEDVVMDASGALYGATSQGGAIPCKNGGAHGCGLVFKLLPPAGGSTKWQESTVYNFTGLKNDGNRPITTPAFGLGGLLYGVTAVGGEKGCGGEGCGTVFSINP